MKIQNADNGSSASPATEPTEYDYLRNPLAACLDANGGIILQAFSRTAWRVVPRVDYLSPRVFQRLHQMIRQGTIASILIDPPGGRPVYFVHADVAAILREFTCRLVDECDGFIDADSDFGK